MRSSEIGQARARGSVIAIACAAFVAVLPGVSAPADDWGYADSQKGQTQSRSTAVEPLRAQPAKSLKAGPAKPLGAAPGPLRAAPAKALGAGASSDEAAPLFARPTQAGSARSATGAAAPPSGEHNYTSADGQQAVSDWIELYELASKQPLTEEQKTRFRQELVKKMHTNKRSDVLSILTFWPKAKQEIAGGDEEREGYAALFRALLRFQSKAKDLASEDGEILPELLGPERVALNGDPPLTEDAIDAYADMACFMYEKRHPGKTVDAVDNRTVFASVICNKYTEAPTAQARKAMANFALSWAKFRIAWAVAGKQQREQLLASLEAGSKPPEELNDKAVELILRTGPWAQSKM